MGEALHRGERPRSLFFKLLLLVRLLLAPPVLPLLLLCAGDVLESLRRKLIAWDMVGGGGSSRQVFVKWGFWFCGLDEEV